MIFIIEKNNIWYVLFSAVRFLSSPTGTSIDGFVTYLHHCGTKELHGTLLNENILRFQFCLLAKSAFAER